MSFLLLVRLTISVAAVLLWYWGTTNWPRQPEPHGAGFWAWAAGLMLLWVAWRRGRLARTFPHLHPLDGAAAVLVLVAGAARFYRVTEVPFAIHFDEVNGLAWIEMMSRGETENLFGWINPLGPGLLLAPEWLLGYIVPNRFVVSRLLSAFWGTLSIALTYLLARRLYTRPIALAASLILATSYWHFIDSRFQPFFLYAAAAATLAWWALTRACQSGRLGDGVSSGLVIGLALETYDPVKILLVAVPAWWLWHALVTRGFARRTIVPFAATVLVAWMVLQPMLAHAGWRDYFRRVLTVTSLGQIIRTGGPTEMGSAGSDVAESLRRFSKLATGGAAVAANHPSPAPMLNWFEIAAATIGLIAAVRLITRWQCTVAPLWLGLTAAAVIVSSVPESSYRLALALPALSMLAAHGALEALRVGRRVLTGRIGTAAVTVGLVLLGWSIGVNASRTIEYLRFMDRAHEMNTLARAIAAGPADSIYFIEAYYSMTEHPVFRAVTGTRTVVTLPNLIDQVPAAVAGSSSAVLVVPYWTSEHSLVYLRDLFPAASVRPIKDPHGLLAGHFVELRGDRAFHALGENGICGLTRSGCPKLGTRVDRHLAFLEPQTLCESSSGRVEWCGSVELPEEVPMEVGLKTNIPATVELDEALAPFDTVPFGQPLPLCLAPGRHSIRISAELSPRQHGPLWLWWSRRASSPTVVPCAALSPLPCSGPRWTVELRRAR